MARESERLRSNGKVVVQVPRTYGSAVTLPAVFTTAHFSDSLVLVIARPVSFKEGLLLAIFRFFIPSSKPCWNAWAQTGSTEPVWKPVDINRSLYHCFQWISDEYLFSNQICPYSLKLTHNTPYNSTPRLNPFCPMVLLAAPPASSARKSISSANAPEFSPLSSVSISYFVFWYLVIKKSPAHGVMGIFLLLFF